VGDGLLVGYWLLVAIWILGTIGFVGALAVSRVLMGPLSCALNSETSVYGQAHWSWEQLGTVCEWNLGPAGSFERGPGMERWAIVIALVSMGTALLLAGRLIFWSRRAALDASPMEPSDTTA
jgi:hypothetical protein